MSAPQPPRWVWISTTESRAAGVVSALAVFETLVCVGIYWALWAVWGVTWHHWIILIATPLVLMRTKASMEKGVDLYGRVLIDLAAPVATRHSIILFLIGIGALAILLITTTPIWLEVTMSPRQFWPVILLVFFGTNIIFAGVLLADLLNTAKIFNWIVNSGGPATILAITLFFVLGISLFWAILALSIRIFATFSHPLLGLKSLPRNWHRFIWANDVKDPLEIMPGNRDTRLRRLVFEDLGWPDTELRATVLKAPFVLLFATVFYLPPLLWRWSIKSTAWFYLPLMLVGRGWQNIDGDTLRAWGNAYATTKLNWTGAILAGAFLFGSALALFLPAEYLRLSQTLQDAGAPMSPVGYILVLDWGTLAAQPWQWFYLPSWGLTLAMFFMIDHHAKHAATDAILRFWMRVGNLRLVLTNIGLLVALWYFLSAVGAWDQIKTAFSVF